MYIYVNISIYIYISNKCQFSNEAASLILRPG